MKDNGGSAFPVDQQELPDGIQIYAECGMSLRDYFATKALHIASFHTDYEFYKGNRDLEGYYKEVADKAFAHADAMLKARTE